MDKVNEIMERWNALKPLSERDRELLSRRFTIDFNYNSNHIEGNTLTYGQTEILLLFGKIIGEAEVKDVQEMTASNVGLTMMREEAQLNDVMICLFHKPGNCSHKSGSCFTNSRSCADKSRSCADKSPGCERTSRNVRPDKRGGSVMLNKPPSVLNMPFSYAYIRIYFPKKAFTSFT